MSDRLPKDYRVYIPLAAVFVLLVLFMPRSTKFNYSYSKGSPWMYETLVAEFDFPILKTASELQQERNSETNSIIPYYKQDRNVGLKVIQELNAIDFGSFVSMKPAVSSSLSSIYQRGVADDTDYFGGRQSGDYDWNLVYVQRDKRAVKKPVEEILSVSSAKLELMASLSGVQAADSLCRELGVYDLIVPDLILDRQMSELVNSENTPEISPTKGVVTAGTVIVSKGEIVTAEVEQILDSYRAEYDSSIGYSGNRAVMWCGNILLAFAIVLVLFFVIWFTSPHIFTQMNRYVYLLLIFTLTAFTASAVEMVSPKTLYLVPFPLFAYYLLAFFRKKLILPLYIVSLIPLLVFGHNGLELFVMHTVAGVVAIYIFDFFNRGWLQFVNALIVFFTLSVVWFAFRFIDGLGGSVDYWVLLWLFFASMISIALYPVIYLFEKIFNLVSSSRLMELSDTNNKALRELASKAPGTFQHSLQVANFADSAARSIDADALLVRAGALYHDIGKVCNPQCFVENETMGETYHQSLDPKESAREIIRHVSDGLQLAEKYKLPSVIMDFIATHHGTTKTAFFYSKYVNAGGDPADVADFTYPGPRPTTKEQVILMLSDTLEAASRTLKDRTPHGISELVDRIVQGKIDEGQFNEADISLKELHTVSENLKEYIRQVYHARVVYPSGKKRKNK